MEITPRCQINYATKVNGQGQVLERSLMVNIRADQIGDAVSTFEDLRKRLGNSLVIVTTENASLPAPEAKQETLEDNEPTPRCGRCDVPMQKRLCRKAGSKYFGQEFWSCPRWKTSGCLTIAAA